MTPEAASGGFRGDHVTIELYDALLAEWIIITDAVAASARTLRFNDPRARDIPEGHTVLARIVAASGTATGFLGRLDRDTRHQRLELSPLEMVSDPGDETRRRDFRIDGVDTEIARLRLPGMGVEEEDLETEIDDVSAGGVGLLVADELLQKLQTSTLFQLTLNLSFDPKIPDPLRVAARLCNVRPAGGGHFHFGLQFIPGDRSEIDINRDTGRLLRYVAQRQRELLRRRPGLKPRRHRPPPP